MLFTGNPALVEELTKISAISPLDIFTPANVAEIRQDFIVGLRTGRVIEPEFRYDDARLKSLASYAERVRELGSGIVKNLCFDDDANAAINVWAVGLLERRTRELYTLLSLAGSIAAKDDARSKELLLRLYGAPVTSMVKHAETMRDTLRHQNEELKRIKRPEEPRPTLDARAIAAEFAKALRAYGFNNWEVQIVNNLNAIAVHPGKKEILIPASRRVNPQKMGKLIGHEVECHIRAHMNGHVMMHRLFPDSDPLQLLIPWLIKSQNEEIHEGIAKISDVNLEAMSLSKLPNKELPAPWYVLGINRALREESNFGTTGRWLYTELQEIGLGPDKAAEQAWDKTYRLYRGVTSPHSWNFINPSSQFYYTGYYQLQSLQLSDPELRDLASDFTTFSISELAGLRNAWHQATEASKDPCLCTLLQPLIRSQCLASNYIARDINQAKSAN